MNTTRISCRRKSKGVSTVLGTLIFIGILFTSVVPMLLVMNQADTIFEQKKLEIRRFDEEHDREVLDVYSYPTSGSESEYITVKVKNRCELSVRIVRVWINDTIESVDSVVKAMSDLEIDDYYVGNEAGHTYDIVVTTERGNVFASGSGTLTYTDTGWEVENLLINVLISSPGVVFKIYLYKWVDPDWIEIDYAQVWKIGGSAFKCFDVTGQGSPNNYKVTVKRGSKTIHEEEVEMIWPDGPSVYWVYA